MLSWVAVRFFSSGGADRAAPALIRDGIDVYYRVNWCLTLLTAPLLTWFLSCNGASVLRKIVAMVFRTG